MTLIKGPKLQLSYIFLGTIVIENKKTDSHE